MIAIRGTNFEVTLAIDLIPPIITNPKTIEIMEGAGYKYYNEIILVNSVGTLALRSGKQMQASRKVGKIHQNVLVFVKGDASVAADKLGEIEINLEEADGD